MNIFVGNLNYQLQEEDLESAFSEFGEVTSVKIIIDRFTGRSKGFGFVEMPNEEEGNQAIEQLNDQDLEGRTMRVNKAHPPKKRENRDSRY
ncbi:MAG TPA: RNA-binding protein [Chitinophagaceae bacterium]|nr:RNA-binding protein [Chitinophagaceae bacterium]